MWLWLRFGTVCGEEGLRTTLIGGGVGTTWRALEECGDTYAYMWVSVGQSI